MSWKNRVVWFEGLFLRPHHFQQHDRYIEDYIEGRSRGLHNHSWGFTQLTLDKDQLAIGKVAVSSAQGVFPDGTPFNIPEDDRPPRPLDLDSSVRECRVHLALPARRFAEREVEGSEQGEGLARYVSREFETQDVSGDLQSVAQMRVGTLRTRLLLDTEQREEYACLGLAHVIEVKADRSVTLDKSYVPPLLDYQVSPVLAGYSNELRGLLHHRGEALAGRVSSSGRGGAAEISEFLFLLAVNRYEPVVAHLATLNGLHPEELYRAWIGIAGELTTFTSKRAPQFPPYRHDDLRATFEPVVAALREALGVVIEQMAVPIPLKDPRFGIRQAPIADRALLTTATFVLAVRADVPTEELRSYFPAQTKIGSVEKIRELVMSQLPGVGIRPLPVAPRQIPFHADFVYFELDRSSEYWPNMQDFAIHVGGDIHGLDMQFWAIRK